VVLEVPPHAREVKFLLDGELCSVGASREVILCAGAIHTPRLLLLSGVGPHAVYRRFRDRGLMSVGLRVCC
jgi:choline dehydrogenase-like flavoprotein